MTALRHGHDSTEAYGSDLFVDSGTKFIEHGSDRNGALLWAQPGYRVGRRNVTFGARRSADWFHVGMKSIILTRYGGPENLEVADVSEPKVGPGEVRVQVKAAGVNPVDWKLAAGGLDDFFVVKFPCIPGWDVAGVVESVGPDAPEFSVGDEVFGYVRKDWVEYGAYAELVTASVGMLARKPQALTFEQAAGIPLVGLTALRTIRLARLRPHETVLIHAAAGGVGSAGTQIAVAEGARVIGTASSPNHSYLADLGATPVEYGDGLVDRVRAEVPDGVDVILDYVGGGAAAQSVELLADRSRLISITDAEAIDLGGRVVWGRPEGRALTELAELADSGRFTMNVARTYRLDEAADAWRDIQSGHTRGKIVLTVDR